MALAGDLAGGAAALAGNLQAEALGAVNLAGALVGGGGALTGDLAAGVPVPALTLADFDQDGREFDALALIEAGTVAGDTYDLWGRAPRTAVGSLIDGEADIADDAEPLTRLRWVDADSRVIINDNGTVDLGVYFSAGGDGADLTISIQNADGVDSQPVADIYFNGGGNFLQVDVGAALVARIRSIGTGARFIFALWRAAATPTASLAGDLTGGAGALTGDLQVQASGTVALAGGMVGGAAALAGDLSATTPAPAALTLYLIDNTGDELWLINPTDPGDESGDFGLVGEFATGLSVPFSMTSHAGDLYVADSTGDELWRINPADPDDEAGGFGLVGTFPVDLTFPTGMTSHGGSLYVADSAGDELWRINPANPSDESGVFGLVGTFPTDLTNPGGMTSHDGSLYVVDNTGDELWRINPDDPDDESGDFGEVGTLPSGLTIPSGMTSHDGSLYVVDNDGDELWLINLANPSDETGGFGLVGEFPTGVASPNGLASFDASGDVALAGGVVGGAGELTGNLDAETTGTVDLAGARRWRRRTDRQPRRADGGPDDAARHRRGRRRGAHRRPGIPRRGSGQS